MAGAASPRHSDRDLRLPPAPSASEQPTTVAVALHHDTAAGGAPRIVASGRGAIAEQILELAFAHGIKVRADADLAEILAAVEVGERIPLAAFAAVAEILFHLYRANQQAAPDATRR
jgi:flagellar biosynthesis protein